MQLLHLNEDIMNDIQLLATQLITCGKFCATAESCTGGLLGASLTAAPGASQWFAGGIMAYANAAKVGTLSVDPKILETQGAVSEAVVRQMAENVCRLLNVQVGVSVSGVAGPSGGTALKPVGLVWLGYCIDGSISAQELRLTGDREAIRTQTVQEAIKGLCIRLKR